MENLYAALKLIVNAFGKKINTNTQQINSEVEKKEEEELSRLIRDNKLEAEELGKYAKKLALQRKADLVKEREKQECYAQRRLELDSKNVVRELEEVRKIKLMQAEVQLLEEERTAWTDRARERRQAEQDVSKQWQVEWDLKEERDNIDSFCNTTTQQVS